MRKSQRREREVGAEPGKLVSPKIIPGEGTRLCPRGGVFVTRPEALGTVGRFSSRNSSR